MRSAVESAHFLNWWGMGAVVYHSHHQEQEIESESN